MRKYRLLFFFLFLVISTQSQNNTPKYGIDFSGFVKNDFFWDSRQNVTIREGHFLLYPMPISEDADKNDINAKSNFNFLSIQSRLSGKITGPDAFKAKTSGLIEADFFGNENTNFADVNGFRLRHAYVKLNWEKSELIFGQTWHPMFIAGCFPGVVSFSTGSPFQPFSRNPQIKWIRKIGKLSLAISANSQRDFTSPGGSSASLRNSSIPEVHVQGIFETKNETSKKELLIGMGAGYKTIVPRLYSEVITTPESYVLDTNTNKITHTYAKTTKYKTDEKLGGYAVYGFIKYKMPVLTAKFYATYGQNLFDLTMLGGYAISGTSDPIKSLKNILLCKQWLHGEKYKQTEKKFKWAYLQDILKIKVPIKIYYPIPCLLLFPLQQTPTHQLRKLLIEEPTLKVYIEYLLELFLFLKNFSL